MRVNVWVLLEFETLVQVMERQKVSHKSKHDFCFRPVSQPQAPFYTCTKTAMHSRDGQYFLWTCLVLAVPEDIQSFCSKMKLANSTSSRPLGPMIDRLLASR